MARKKSSSKGSSDNGEFDEPQVPEDQQTEIDDDYDADSVEMLAPPDDPELQAALDEDSATDEADYSAEADPVIMAAKAEIEQSLQARVSSMAADAASFDVDGGDMIQGVGIGTPEIDMEQIGEGGPGSQVLNIYTAEKLSQEECRRCLYDDHSVHAAADDGMAMNVFETGFIDTQPHRHKQRPSPNGISVGHFRITAGTQGALSRGRRAPRDRRVLMLSNNHVLANSNGGRFGDSILQPGRADGGQNPRDRVAILERFVPINFGGGANYVDCATGWCWPSRVRREFIYRSGSGFRLFRVSSVPTLARRGMIVGKTGRTTQLRAGRVTGTSETIRVNFGGGRVALFRDQIAIRGIGRPFSAGGDSGSLIWTWDRNRRPVGLLFAGGGGVTFGNKIHRVLSALDIRLWT